MTQSYEIRTMTSDEVLQAVDWAGAEGWNPGRRDAVCFRAVDPDGFIGGFVGGEMIGSISVVNYREGFAFLGFYIVAPEWRGQGYGLRLWNAALGHAGDRVIQFSLHAARLDLRILKGLFDVVDR